MNKSELVEAIAHGSGVTKAVAHEVLGTFMATVIHVLKKDGQVVIPGFGTFSKTKRKARAGRNPQTGQVIQIKASNVAKFKAGKTLKEAVQ